LASIHSDAENSFVYNLRPDPSALRWIDPERNRLNTTAMVFVNRDGSPFDYNAFNVGSNEPNDLNGNEDCVQMGVSLFWNDRWKDHPCFIKREYVCKQSWSKN
jgi:hypothetical protein